VSGRQHGYGQHLLAGLEILRARWVSRPVGWVKKGATDGARIGRGVALAAAAWAVVRVVVSSWKVLVVVVLVVVVLALRAATKAAKGELPGPAGATAPPPAGGLPDVSADQFMGLLRDVLGVAAGVHLRTLATALSARTGVVWEVADVRRLCAAHRVPVRPTVRAPGGGPTVGVHRDDLPLLPGPSPAPAPAPAGGVVAAGQAGTTAATTPAATTPATPTSTVHGGLRIVAVDDPDNPARTHVRVIDGARRKRA
jgi:hypothetical protein